MSGPDKSILAVFAWPNGVTDEAKGRAIAAVTGKDPHQSALFVRRSGFPQVFGAMDPADADAAQAKLAQAGVDAMSVPARDLGAHTCRDLVKRFIEGHDDSGVTWLAELWMGAPRVVRAADLVVVVRGRFSLDAGTDFDVNHQALDVSVSASGRINVAPSTEPMVSTSKRKRIADVLDLHFVGAPPLRVHADKMSFDVLADGRGITDNENMDLLAVHFAEVAPHAAVDVDFKSFRPPSDAVRSFHLAAGKRGDPRVTTPVEFELYSAWAAVRQLSLLG